MIFQIFILLPPDQYGCRLNDSSGLLYRCGLKHGEEFETSELFADGSVDTCEGGWEFIMGDLFPTLATQVSCLAPFRPVLPAFVENYRTRGGRPTQKNRFRGLGEWEPPSRMPDDENYKNDLRSSGGTFYPDISPAWSC